MRFHNLDLNLLVALDNMLRLRNISRAAEQMHITQSAMSNALGRLREFFDDPLLVPVGRRMALTPRAEALIAPLRDIMVRIDSAIVVGPSFDPATSSREFRILLSDFSMNTVIPALLAAIAPEAPTVRLRLLPQTESPHLLLEKGEADLLIAPRSLCSTAHPVEHVFEDEICCIVWTGNPLAKGMSREAFLAARHVVVQPPSNGWTYDSIAYENEGLVRNIAATTYTFTALPALIAGTPFVATIHRRLALAAQAHLPIAVLPTPITIPTLEQMVQWHEYRTSDPGLLWLRQRLVAAGQRIDQ